jgi:hypothetical protein
MATEASEGGAGMAQLLTIAVTVACTRSMFYPALFVVVRLLRHHGLGRVGVAQCHRL